MRGFPPRIGSGQALRGNDEACEKGATPSGEGTGATTRRLMIWLSPAYPVGGQLLAWAGMDRRGGQGARRRHAGGLDRGYPEARRRPVGCHRWRRRGARRSPARSGGWPRSWSWPQCSHPPPSGGWRRWPRARRSWWRRRPCGRRPRWSALPFKLPNIAYPVAVGAGAVAHGLPLEPTVQAFATFAARPGSAGVRSIPLDRPTACVPGAAGAVDRASSPKRWRQGSMTWAGRRWRRYRLDVARNAEHAAVQIVGGRRGGAPQQPLLLLGRGQPPNGPHKGLYHECRYPQTEEAPPSPCPKMVIRILCRSIGILRGRPTSPDHSPEPHIGSWCLFQCDKYTPAAGTVVERVSTIMRCQTLRVRHHRKASSGKIPTRPLRVGIGGRVGRARRR